jgi:uncharacterized membrane protein YraQ (UPF0718 family)
MAFLFTSPLVNPVIIPLLITLLGLEVTLVYASVAIGMTILISFLLDTAGFSRYIIGDVLNVTNGQKSPAAGAVLPSAGACCDATAPQPGLTMVQPVGPCCSSGVPEQNPGPAFSIPVYQEPPNRWRRILGGAVNQFKTLLPYVIAGVAIGSVIHGFLPGELVVRLAGADNPLAVPASAVIGIPLYLRVSTMVPIASSLVAKGMSLGAVTALIIGGAGASLPEVAMLKGMFRLPLLVGFIASVMVMAVSAGYLVNMIL